jgi:hypothetical protein
MRLQKADEKTVPAKPELMYPEEISPSGFSVKKKPPRVLSNKGY